MSAQSLQKLQQVTVKDFLTVADRLSAAEERDLIDTLVDVLCDADDGHFITAYKDSLPAEDIDRLRRMARAAYLVVASSYGIAWQEAQA